MSTIQHILEQAKTLSKEELGQLVYDLMSLAEIFPFMIVDAPSEYQDRDEEEVNVDYETYLAAVKDVHDWWDVSDDYSALTSEIERVLTEDKE